MSQSTTDNFANMISPIQRLSSMLLMLCLCAVSTGAAASAYEARLPAELDTASDLCVYAPCREVLPLATRFSHRKGEPPFVEGYDDRDNLVGYVMLSTDITDIPAYSGKPIINLIGIHTGGFFTGIKILKHSEPILLLGIPEKALTDFNQQYIGKFVGDKIEVGQTRDDEDVIGVDAISGATVTVVVQNQLLLASGAAVARQTGILEPVHREQARLLDLETPLDWNSLVAEGSVRDITVRAEDVGLEPDEDPFIELWFGYLNHPDIGRSILGERGWRRLMDRLEEGEHALFVIRTAGKESFKGSGFVRGGIYDRILVRQDVDVFTFRDLDYLNLYGIESEGAPSFSESGIFIIRSPGFSAAYPWQLVFLGNRIDQATGQRSFANFDTQYWLADKYLEGGRPRIEKAAAPWVRIWRMRTLEITLFTAFLLAVAAVHAGRDRLTRLATHRNKWPVEAFKYAAWVISIGFVGFHLMAQPSITQVLTWFHALLFQWTWELFLTDPFIFIFWIFIIVTVFVWGRGLFCGWLCPFGSLTELIYKVAGVIGLKRFQFQLPKRVHDHLKWLKYGIFFVLLAVSVFSMVYAEVLAEVEPFKTTFLVGLLNRAWPYTLFAAGLLALSIFMERPFCKYLCPLGAALAMPSTFRWYGLRRKQECSSCHACAAGCGSLAIDDHGRIDHRECLLCLDCMILYTDTQGCPPLAKERKRRSRNNLPLTPIGHDGYYVPIESLTGHPKAGSPKA